MNHGAMHHDTIDPDDPLLIAQSLTYITDDGSTVLSFTSAPFSSSFKARFMILEFIFVFLLIAAVPIGAHGTIVSISVGNLIAVAWFWYNSVRSVDITADGGLRFWIGNVEIDVPFDKIVDMRRIAGECSIISPHLLPHRGYLTAPTDGVAVVTSVPTTPFFLWPRSSGRPERHLGPFVCPRLKIVFSPAGGGLNFIREVENEMRNAQGEEGGRNASRERQQPPEFAPSGAGVRPNVGGASSEFIDV